MFQHHKFSGHSSEDLDGYLAYFLELAHTVKVNGLPHEVIKMILFPFFVEGQGEIVVSMPSPRIH